MQATEDKFIKEKHLGNVKSQGFISPKYMYGCNTLEKLQRYNFRGTCKNVNVKAYECIIS
jgi:hypothetical protein